MKAAPIAAVPTQPATLPGSSRAAESDNQAPGKREKEDQPGPCGVHPRSSRISSTSSAIRRRNIATIRPRPMTTSQAATTMTTSAKT